MYIQQQITLTMQKKKKKNTAITVTKTLTKPQQIIMYIKNVTL